MAKKDTHKKTKFEERLLNELNSLLRKGLNDARLQKVSFTKVELSPDYSHATVSWDTFDASTRGDAKLAVESAKGRIRSELARVLEVRHVPSISFIYDNQFEEEKKITDLLNRSMSEEEDE